MEKGEEERGGGHRRRRERLFVSYIISQSCSITLVTLWSVALCFDMYTHIY